MNHDEDLKNLWLALKIVLAKFDGEIHNIKDPKHRVEQIQQFDKICHYMIKMTLLMDEMNRWLTAFGDKDEDSVD